MTEPKRPLKVFLCHAHADRDTVRALYTRLTNDGVDAWLDKEKLLGGSDWEYEIRKAVRDSDVVIVCHSNQFNQKGFRQKEVKIALEEADLLPKGEIFIIPVRLDECEVLDDLQKWHWVDLFDDDGYIMLMRALRARANNIGATLQIKKSWLPNIKTPSESDVLRHKLAQTPQPKKQLIPQKEIQSSRNFNRTLILVLGFLLLAFLGGSWIITNLIPLAPSPTGVDVIVQETTRAFTDTVSHFTPTNTIIPRSTSTKTLTPKPTITKTRTPIPSPLPTNITLTSIPTVNSVTAILDAHPTRGKAPLTVNFSANLKRWDGVLLCSDSSACTFTWWVNYGGGSVANLDSKNRTVSYNYIYDGRRSMTVTVCYGNLCDTTGVTIYVE